MKLVITDGYTLNPGDLDWKPFQQFGELTYYDRTNHDQIMERCIDADVIITNKTPIDESVMQSAKSLRMIAVTATGYNIIDTTTAKKLGIFVCNVPEYGTHSVAQHTFALLLEFTNHVGKNSQSVKEGEWTKSIDWCYSKSPIIELKNKVLGIVGLGKIGNQTAAIAYAFGMNIIYHGGRPSGIPGREVRLEELFSESDFISLHCPVTADNQAFVNKGLLQRMKPSAFLINTSRGQLIQELDLADALNNGVLAGAALDVLSKEPPPSDHPLLNASNCLMTPHNAWLSFEARERIINTTFTNIEAVLKGQPVNLV